MTHLGAATTACVGVWRAATSGQFYATMQAMGCAWAVLLLIAVLLLYCDGIGAVGVPPPSSPRASSRASPRASSRASSQEPLRDVESKREREPLKREALKRRVAKAE